MRLIKDLGMKLSKPTSKQKRRHGLYECPKCNVEFEALVHNVKRGNTSCCLSCKNVTHGESGTRLYKIWHGMHDRCYNQDTSSYSRYGGRGITIADSSWYSDFDSFKRWSLRNGYSDSLTIDRINNDGNYEPSNCRWADKTTQNNNRGVLRSNTTGYNGVKFSGNKSRFIASISINRRTKHIGTFDSAEEAVIARDAYIHVNSLPHKTTHKFQRIKIGA